MTIMSALRRILNDTPATATNIDYNFQVLQDYINAEVVTTDGSNSISGPLVVGDPVADNHAATKGYVDGLWFPGLIMDYGGGTAPEGWVLCNGGTYSSTDPKYRDLFNVIHYDYGDAGGGNFKVPSFQGRVAMGHYPGGTWAQTLGSTGGQPDSELRDHNHFIPEHGHGHSISASGSSNSVWTDHLHNFSTGDAGGHTHGWGAEAFLYNSAQASGYGLTSDGGGGIRTAVWSGDGNHSHTGTTGGVNNNYPDAANHSHIITVSIAGGVSNQARFLTETYGGGTTFTNKNLPPYTVCNKIIKL